MALIPERVETDAADIQVELRKVRFGARPQFENLFGQYALGDEGLSGMNVPVGTIKNLALKHALRKLTVNGEIVKIDRNDPASSLDRIEEDVLDKLDEEGVVLFEALVGLVVKHSRWLGQQPPFSMVFARYLPEDEQRSDPTEDSSSISSTPDSGTSETS